MSPEDVNVLLFQRDNFNADSEILVAQFNEKGQLTNWPFGFLIQNNVEHKVWKMLFYITNSLKVEKEDIRYLHIRKVIRNLLTGYSESKLLLMADYEVLEWMVKLFAEDEDLVSPIKYLYNNYAIMGIPKEIKYYWEVVDGTQLETLRIEGDKTIFSISYLVLQDSASTQNVH